MTARRPVLQSALVALFLLVVGAAVAGGGALKTETVTITRKDGSVVRFRAEIAASRKDREIGLMNRTELAADAAMLFDFGENRRATMWMKNTLIALDMLFADQAGRVVRIKRMAEPGSLAIIDSGQDVRFVLEIAGGSADRLGLAEGDLMASDQIARASP